MGQRNFDFEGIRDIVRSELERGRRAVPPVSLRSFANRLGTSAAALSEMIRGKRPITRRTAQNLIERWPLDRELAQRIQSLIVAATPEGKDPQRETDAIRKLIADYEVAFNRHDAREMARMWAPRGCLIEPWGRKFDGRDAIEKFYRVAHATGLRKAQTHMEVKSVTMLGNTTAFADIDAAIWNVVQDPNPVPFDLHLNIPVTVVKVRGQWRHQTSRPYTALPASSQPWGDNAPTGEGR